MTGKDKSEPGTGRLVWSKGLQLVCTAADPAYDLHFSFSVCATSGMRSILHVQQPKINIILFGSKCTVLSVNEYTPWKSNILNNISMNTKTFSKRLTRLSFI